METYGNSVGGQCLDVSVVNLSYLGPIHVGDSTDGFDVRRFSSSNNHLLCHLFKTIISLHDN